MRSKAIAVVVAVVGSVVIPASPASATPTNCDWWGAGMNAYAICRGGYGGAYQSYTTCRNVMWPFNEKFVESPWYPAGSGRVANAQCPFLFDVKNPGVGLRR
jgi:hypothetical protein